MFLESSCSSLLALRRLLELASSQVSEIDTGSSSKEYKCCRTLDSHDSVSTGADAVHPIGQPIIHSANTGLSHIIDVPPFGEPVWTRWKNPATSERGRLFLCMVSRLHSVDLWSLAVTVGHMADGILLAMSTKSWRSESIFLDSWSTILAMIFAHDVLSPCEDEDAVPLMLCSNGIRAEHAPFRIVPCVGQRPEYDAESFADEPVDVFHEHVLGSYLANDSKILEPESGSLSVDACSFSCGGQVLTGEASNDEIHSSTPRCAIEGSHIAIDRSFIQASVFHA